MNDPYLLFLGFIVGLSGAMIPGPLLVYTIAESLRKGWKTGFYVIVGHAIVEVGIMAFLIMGVSALMTSELFVKSVSLVGGAFMAYTAVTLFKSSWEIGETKDALRYGTVAGGMLFTALNPSFPVWWATAGARLLVEGFKNAGLTGALMVFIGHWMADFGYFMVVSSLVTRGREKLISRYVNTVKNILAALLLAIGAYFITTGL
ncbi:MAG: hypothetical protein GF416_06935 [Candidatus Altiarchaeales archaeon]|nr:hypothetical protein [Candidatus Altiarchaeales archaeon]MBD3416847.1 hypothetical protein [Candidatus Altiarchaeales archaeon]